MVSSCRPTFRRKLEYHLIGDLVPAAEGERRQSLQHNGYEPAAGVSCIRKQTESDASAIKTLPEFNSGEFVHDPTLSA
jgi:hypothetical protein